MASRRPQLVTMYVLSLAATMTLLVVWIVYVVRSGSRIAALGRRVGVASGGSLNWTIETRCPDDLACGRVGCVAQALPSDKACVRLRTEEDNDQGTN